MIHVDIENENNKNYKKNDYYCRAFLKTNHVQMYQSTVIVFVDKVRKIDIILKIYVLI